MNENENIEISIPINGKTVECLVVMTFKHENVDYIALLPKDEQEKDEMNILMYEYSINEKKENELTMKDIPIQKFNDIIDVFKENVMEHIMDSKEE